METSASFEARSAPSPYPTTLQGARCRTGQTPAQARRRIVKVNPTTQAGFRHLFHDRCAEPTPIRCGHGWPVAFDPIHSESVAIGAPANIDTSRIRRERPVLPRIGGELMECQSDALRTSRLHA
jgi:hypothetical protein